MGILSIRRHTTTDYGFSFYFAVLLCALHKRLFVNEIVLAYCRVDITRKTSNRETFRRFFFHFPSNGTQTKQFEPLQSQQVSRIVVYNTRKFNIRRRNQLECARRISSASNNCPRCKHRLLVSIN